jgi:hypothetical protein
MSSDEIKEIIKARCLLALEWEAKGMPYGSLRRWLLNRIENEFIKDKFLVNKSMAEKNINRC